MQCETVGVDDVDGAVERGQWPGGAAAEDVVDEERALEGSCVAEELVA